MPRPILYVWKKAPFLRLVPPFIAGIILQWYCHPPIDGVWIIFISTLLLFMLFNFRFHFYQLKSGWINGMLIHCFLITFGLLIGYYNSVSHAAGWLKNYYRENDVVVATIEEPLTEKSNSYKALASVQQVIENSRVYNVEGNIICYFKKDSAVNKLVYGSRIIFRKRLEPIRNTGNPGTFDYERYAAFAGIYHQVYLQAGEFNTIENDKGNWLKKSLFKTREWVVSVMADCIPGKKESGLAEALLIGYKDDLDKTLVQSYTNTGVVHIIAISGLHLGLIYWLLNMLASPLKKRKDLRWLKTCVIIVGLWLFAVLAGGGPSILRSAVMFTCIVIGESIDRKTSIYNSLAASAFLLLCINPCWLWDAGFQLSYTALLSIVIFTKPVYNWFYFKNKILDSTWKLSAVTLAAQVLTTPVSIYHFHQFPIYFLITNLLAVPLSSLIVLGEILLCVIAMLPVLAVLLGQVLHVLIQIMNNFIEHMENLPFSQWQGLSINLPQLVLLYCFIAATCSWLIHKNKTSLKTGLMPLLIFFCIRSYSFIEAACQQKIIVYNIPRHQAIDFISGRNYYFVGDTILKADDFLQYVNLRPSRIMYRMNVSELPAGISVMENCYVFANKKILIIDKTCLYKAGSKKITVDVIIVSRNPSLNIPALANTFVINRIVFDGSNPQWKVNKWMADCAKLGLACFSVVDKGAFVMKMD